MLRSDVYSTGKLIVFLLTTWERAWKFLLQPIGNTKQLVIENDIENNLPVEEKQLVKVIQQMLDANREKRQKISKVISILKQLGTNNIDSPEKIFSKIFKNLPPSKVGSMSERTLGSKILEQLPTKVSGRSLDIPTVNDRYSYIDKNFSKKKLICNYQT